MTTTQIPTQAPTQASTTPMTRKDFLSSVDPKWCVGCGCYGVFGALTKLFPTLGVPREKFAVISGIGCSSRLPYYANTYGFHTIHGRAPTVAMGLKLANPDLSVWMITGDGDALSIGGNHFMHLMRRNPDIKVILINNQIYGLTKGQLSPTSPMGKTTKTTPYGSIDRPVRPLALALGAGATFAARVLDTDGEMLGQVLAAASQHKGTAFVEVLVNCVIFNEGTFAHLSDKATKADTTVRMREGQPLTFGQNSEKLIALRGSKPEVFQLAEGQTTPPNAVVHNPRDEDPSAAFMLAQMEGPDLPVPLGIFRQVQAPVYGESVAQMTSKAKEEECEGVLRGSTSWKV